MGDSNRKPNSRVTLPRLDHASAGASSTSSQSHRDAQNILRLRVNRVSLVQQLNADPVVDYLHREGILSEVDVGFIRRGIDRHERTRLLLDTLPSKGASTLWYSKFRNSLAATSSSSDPTTAQNHRILADFLDATDLAALKAAQQQEQRFGSHLGADACTSPPPLPPIRSNNSDKAVDADADDVAASTEHRRQWKALRSRAKSMVEQCLPDTAAAAPAAASVSWLTRLPLDLTEHVARTYAAWSTESAAAAVKRERRCLARLRVVDELARRAATAKAPLETLALLCLSSPLRRLLGDTKHRHLAYKYLLAEAPELSGALASAFAELTLGSDSSLGGGRRRWACWSTYAAVKLANLAGRLFDFLEGACQFAACETVANSLCTYLQRYGGDRIEALLPIYRANLKLTEARLNNAQHRLADAAHQAALAAASRVSNLSFGRRILDNQAPLHALTGRLMLEQGSLVSAIGAFSSAIANVDLDDGAVVFKILYHALDLYILNSDEGKAEKLAVACVQHA